MSVQNNSDSDSSFNLDVEDKEFLPKNKRKRKFENGKNQINSVKPPVFSTEIPFEEVNRALKYLNSPFEPVSSKYCSHKKIISDSCYADKTLLHYCYLIQKAILRHEWNRIPRLLIAYIDEHKSGKSHYCVIVKYATIYFLNDPIAKRNKLLTELFSTVLAARNERDIKLFFKRCLSSPYMVQYRRLTKG